MMRGPWKTQTHVYGYAANDGDPRLLQSALPSRIRAHTESDVSGVLEDSEILSTARWGDIRPLKSSRGGKFLCVNML